MSVPENDSSEVEFVLNMIGPNGPARLREIANRKSRSAFQRAFESVGPCTFGWLSANADPNYEAILQCSSPGDLQETHLNVRVCERRGKRFDLLINGFPNGLTPKFALRSKFDDFSFEQYKSRVWLFDQEEQGLRLSASDQDFYAAEGDNEAESGYRDDSPTVSLQKEDEWTHDWSSSDGLLIRFRPKATVRLKSFCAQVQLFGEQDGERTELLSQPLEFAKHETTFYADLQFPLKGLEWIDLVVSPITNPMEMFAIQTPTKIELAKLAKQSHLVRIRPQRDGSFRFDNLAPPTKLLVSLSRQSSEQEEIAKEFALLRPVLEIRAARLFSLKTGKQFPADSEEVQEIVAELAQRLVTKSKFVKVRKRHEAAIRQERQAKSRIQQVDTKIRSLESRSLRRSRSSANRMKNRDHNHALISLRRRRRVLLIQSKRSPLSFSDDVPTQLRRMMMVEIGHLTSDHLEDYYRYVGQTVSHLVGDDEEDFLDRLEKSPLDRRTIIRESNRAGGVAARAAKNQRKLQKRSEHVGIDKVWRAIDILIDEPNWISFLPDELVATTLYLTKLRSTGSIATVGGDSIEALARFKNEAAGLSFDEYTEAHRNRIVDDLRRESNRIVESAMDIALLMEFQCSGRSPGNRIFSEVEIELLLRAKVKGQSTSDLLCDSNPPLALYAINELEDEITLLESEKSVKRLGKSLSNRLKELKAHKKELIQNFKNQLFLAYRKLDMIAAIADLRGMKKISHQEILFLENWLLRPNATKAPDNNNPFGTTKVDVEAKRKRLGTMVHASIVMGSDEFRRLCGSLGKLLVSHVAIDGRTIEEAKNLIEAEIIAKKRTVKLDFLKLVGSVLEVWNNRIHSSLVPSSYVAFAADIGRQIFTFKLVRHDPDANER